MPFTYLPGPAFLQIVAGQIEFVVDGRVVCTMTPDEARSNAADLIEAANAIQSGNTIRIGSDDLKEGDDLWPT